MSDPLWMNNDKGNSIILYLVGRCRAMTIIDKASEFLFCPIKKSRNRGWNKITTGKIEVKIPLFKIKK